MISESGGSGLVTIEPYCSRYRAAALELAIESWESVFKELQDAVPGFVYDNFYPNGWKVRQESDLAQVLDSEPDGVDVAMIGDEVVGWVCTRLHPEDSMGEMYVLTVSPAHQRRGVAQALIEHSHERVRAAGMNMIMVEAGGDPGHASARVTYEANGFERWPVARYFKELSAK